MWAGAGVRRRGVAAVPGSGARGVGAPTLARYPGGDRCPGTSPLDRACRVVVELEVHERNALTRSTRADGLDRLAARRPGPGLSLGAGGEAVATVPARDPRGGGRGHRLVVDRSNALRCCALDRPQAGHDRRVASSRGPLVACVPSCSSRSAWPCSCSRAPRRPAGEGGIPATGSTAGPQDPAPPFSLSEHASDNRFSPRCDGDGG